MSSTPPVACGTSKSTTRQQLDEPQDYDQAAAARTSIESQVPTNPATDPINTAEPEMRHAAYTSIEPTNLATDLITTAEPELMRTGRRGKRKDMSGLSLCLCGESALPGDARSIQCQRAGCETVWVSNPGLLPLGSSRLNLLWYSTTLNALGTTMCNLEVGPVRSAR
jgi:hypothetical protein